MVKMPITLKGLENLRKELHKLVTEDRVKISHAIGEAIKMGDLKENAEYHTNKDLQGLIEAKIRLLESQIANALVIDISKITDVDRIVFGATVHLLNIDDQQKIVYQIVGEYEADIKMSKISITSPVAKALIGKEMDDVIQVQAPGGMIEYQIIDIQYIAD
jgi:transcription elongation factor GreA